MKDNVFCRLHKDDGDMIEIYSIDEKNRFILWGVLHVDVLTEMSKITPQDIENHEHQVIFSFPHGMYET